MLINLVSAAKMVLMDALANALKSINNAEKRGKRQVRLQPDLIGLELEWPPPI